MVTGERFAVLDCLIRAGLGNTPQHQITPAQYRAAMAEKRVKPSAAEALRRLAEKRSAATLPKPSRMLGRIRGPGRARAGGIHPERRAGAAVKPA